MLPHCLAHSVVPRLVLPIIESGHSSEPNALFCFMTNSITPKGIQSYHRALENHKKKFLCVSPNIFYCFPRGGSMAYAILSGCLRSKHFENYWTFYSFCRRLPWCSDLLSNALPWPSLSGLVRTLWSTKKTKICLKFLKLNKNKSQIQVSEKEQTGSLHWDLMQGMEISPRKLVLDHFLCCLF